MDKQLTQFVDFLISHTSADIGVQSNRDKPGFAVINRELNFQLNLYSDIYGTYYFEFSFLKDNTGAYTDVICSKFKTDNFLLVNPVLEKLMLKLDSVDQIQPESDKYLELFRKILKCEPLPDGFEANITPDFVKLDEQGNNLSLYIDQYDIYNIRASTEVLTPPTFLRIINIQGAKYPIILHIPEYEMKDFKLLHHFKIQKCKNSSVDSFSQALKDLSMMENIPKNEIHDMIHYLQLENEIPQKKPTQQVNKPKI